MMNFLRSITCIVLFVAACMGQHWQGSVSFPATPNGPQTFDITINNSDTANSGVGTVDKANGAATNIPFTWTRDGAGNIIISVEGVPVAGLAGVPQGQAEGTGGEAVLNDGVPQSAGTYERTNAP